DDGVVVIRRHPVDGRGEVLAEFGDGHGVHDLYVRVYVRYCKVSASSQRSPHWGTPPRWATLSLAMFETLAVAARDRKRLTEITSIAARFGLGAVLTRLGL